MHQFTLVNDKKLLSFHLYNQSNDIIFSNKPDYYKTFNIHFSQGK